MYRKYDAEKLISILDNIKIERTGNTISTYYQNRLINATNVTKVYEVFDFPAYAKLVIESIRKADGLEFEKFDLDLTGGVQILRFNSKPIIINGEEFVKCLYILNSTNRLRALQIRYSLFCNDFEFINQTGAVYKKHYNGVTDFANENIVIDPAIFNEHIAVIQKASKCTINIKEMEVIIKTSMRDVDSEADSANKRFGKFCRNLAAYIKAESEKDINERLNQSVPSNYYEILNSNPTFTYGSGFNISAYTAMKAYLGLYRNSSCFDKIRESERIYSMTMDMQRNEIFELLGL